MLLASYQYPILDFFLTMLYFFFFVIWIWLLITVFVDIFRSHDMGGWAKALWVIFVIILPFLGVFVYLIARGGKMHERAAVEAAQQQKAFDHTSARRPEPTEAPPTSSPSWPTSSSRGVSPTPSSRPRSRRSWLADGCPHPADRETTHQPPSSQVGLPHRPRRAPRASHHDHGGGPLALRHPLRWSEGTDVSNEAREPNGQDPHS